ncbi:MAG: hypothetical protein COB10_10495 [Planctomycetota bacterium]|nr:MAG: hypothetical protein COB10_10495 [Planctomycetota bacterium]HIC24225.1 FHA domain-containing protein [Planctomycetota bacterium]
MNLRLLIHDGSPRQIPLDEGTITLGRSRSCTVQLEDPILSRQHCAITVDKGRVVVADLGSSNGTFVQGDLIEVRTIEQGEVIELGSVCLLLVGTSTDFSTLDPGKQRNPDRIEQLIELAKDGAQDLPRAGEELQRSASRAPQLIAEISSDHLIDELVTLLIRNHPGIRNALTGALDRMISDKILEKSTDGEELRARTRAIIEQELKSENFGDPDEVD